MKLCIKSCLVVSLGLFFLYLIIRHIFELRIEGFDDFSNWFDPNQMNVPPNQMNVPSDSDPTVFSDIDRITQLQTKNAQLRKLNSEDITTINNQKRQYDLEQNVNAILAKDVANKGVLLEAEKNKMSKEDAYNLVLHDKLKKSMKENHRMHKKIDKLDHEVTKKDDELSKIESELFKCIQTQIRHRPTHTPKPPQAVFGNVNFASKTLTL